MEPPTPEAPPAITVVRDFVNTTDRETGPTTSPRLPTSPATSSATT